MLRTGSCSQSTAAHFLRGSRKPSPSKRTARYRNAKVAAAAVGAPAAAATAVLVVVMGMIRPRAHLLGLEVPLVVEEQLPLLAAAEMVEALLPQQAAMEAVAQQIHLPRRRLGMATAAAVGAARARMAAQVALAAHLVLEEGMMLAHLAVLEVAQPREDQEGAVEHPVGRLGRAALLLLEKEELHRRAAQSPLRPHRRQQQLQRVVQHQHQQQQRPQLLLPLLQRLQSRLSLHHPP